MKMATPGRSATGEAKSKTDVKLIILGAANVGKTCLLQRYLTGNFAETISSIGASLALKKWGDWNVALWDTAGEEKYASLSAFYCRGASVAILAFDLTNKQSLEKLQEIFIPLLEDSVSNDSCLTVLVGTKLDLVSTNGRQVKKNEASELAESQHNRQKETALKADPNSFLKDIDGKSLYFETSAKTGEGVEELFDHIKSVILSQLEKAAAGRQLQAAGGSSKSKVNRDKTVRLDDPNGPPANRSGGCCGGT